MARTCTSSLMPTRKAHAQFQRDLVAKLPEIEREIDSLVGQISELVVSKKPTALLKRAWWNLAAKFLCVDVEADVTVEDALAMRMVDYVQSIIASVDPAENQQDEVNDDDWDKLSQLIEDLFNKINVDHAIAVSVKERMERPNFSDIEEEFKYKSKYYWVNVRGQRYYAHQIDALRDTIGPHTKQIQAIWGISADTLIAELEKVWRSLIFGPGEAFERLYKLHSISLDRLEQTIAKQSAAEFGDVNEVMRTVMSAPDLSTQAREVMGSVYGLDLFDLKKITDLPENVLEALSWAPGANKSFFSEGAQAGWPLRVWPIFERPFLKCDDTYYCFDLHSLFDRIYRQVEQCAFAHSQSIKTDWVSQRKALSEELPATYLTKLLPGAIDYGEVYYRWKTGRQDKLNWCEADRLIIFDDILFIIEVKAGAFTWTSPASDFDAHVASIENLVSSPSKQADRFLQYLRSGQQISLYNQSHNEVAQLRHADFRRIFKLAVTLDPFTEMAAQVQYFADMDVDLGEAPVWSVSVDDLRVFSELFSNEIEFVHFLEQRIDAFGSKRLKLDDELDHLGLYLEHNHYRQYAEDSAPSDHAELQFFGYRSAIDQYFNRKLGGETEPSPLAQSMPDRLREVIDYLSRSSAPGRASIGCELLDIDGEWRATIFDQIDAELALTTRRGERPRPLSTFGDVRLSIYAQTPAGRWSLGDVQRHAKSQIVCFSENDRLTLRLQYSQDLQLVGLSWHRIYAKDITSEELPVLIEMGNQLRASRIANAKAQRKVGRNEPCPCGSGKKYKRCCINVR